LTGDGVNFSWQNTTSTYADNQWYHVAAVYNGTTKYIYVNGVSAATPDNQSFANASEDAVIGTSFASAVNSWRYKGNIDNVQVFNYARTPAQIALDYNRGKPVGWWKLDEGEGISAYDSSGSGNTGTLTTMDPPNDWVAGKFGKALDFDGSDDLVNSGDPASGVLDVGTGDFTVCSWIKNSQSLAGDNTHFIIASKKTLLNGSYVGWAYALHGGINDGIELRINDGHTANDNTPNPSSSQNSLLSDGNWHHVCATAVRTNNVTHYIDGKNVGGGAINTNSLTISNGNNFKIASYDGSTSYRFLGQIDDVRVYNYALTAEQIKQIMNEGSAVRFGD
jgi:hypothetical protein